VLVADHGAIVDEDEDQYMALHHIPLLFYSPDTSIVKASLDNALSSQLDVFPSILGCLQLAYQNSSLGINLFEAHRSKLSFTLDADVIGIDSLYYYVEGKMSKGLFKINPNLKNCQTANDSIRLKGLQNYSNAVLQLVYKVQEEKSSVKPRR
jgi:hypothetical protein